MQRNNETPEQRFKRIATLRTNQILDKLRILGNCSNRQIYHYDKEDIDKIFATIEKKVREVKSKFNSTTKDEKFEL